MMNDPLVLAYELADGQSYASWPQRLAVCVNGYPLGLRNTNLAFSLAAARHDLTHSE